MSDVVREVAERVMGWQGRYGFNPILNANDRDRVVERMRELGWWCRIETGYGSKDSFATVTFRTALKKHVLKVTVEDKSAGDAVCQAALKAVEGEERTT